MKQTNLLKGLLVIVVLLCSTQMLAYDFEEDNIQYTVTSLDELTAEVSGLSDTSATEVFIPETVEYKSRTLTVTSIGASAFSGCAVLTEVSIPNSVTSIGSYAFSGCSGLTGITIPNSVTKIGSYAFRGCSGLTEVTILNSLTTIGSYAFYQCSGLTEVVIPSNLISINSYTFAYCTSLRNVTIPESVTTIGEYAFRNCTGLTEATIGSSVTTIGNCAFSECTSLKEVNFNATTCSSAGSSRNNSAFYGCDSISTINFGDNVTIIPAYMCCNITGLTEIIIPNNVTAIGDYAFYNCSSLRELDISNSVTSLGDYFIKDCNALETIKIGAGVSHLVADVDYKQGKSWNESTGSTRTYTYTPYHYYYYSQLWSDKPTPMKNFILKDGISNYSMRGEASTTKTSCRVGGGSASYSYSYSGTPLLQDISIGYYYVGRPLTDIDSWSYTTDYGDGNGNESMRFRINESQPYGTIQTLEIGGYCADVPYFYQSVEYLILDEDVDTYTISNIYQGKLKSIMCKSAKIPPVLSGTFESSTYVNTIIYVPSGSKAIYEATDGWKDFWEIVEMDVNNMTPEYTAVEDIVVDRQANVIGYYTIDGKKVSTPQRGINIIRYSDGTTRKVLMK